MNVSTSRLFVCVCVCVCQELRTPKTGSGTDPGEVSVATMAVHAQGFGWPACDGPPCGGGGIIPTRSRGSHDNPHGEANHLCN